MKKLRICMVTTFYPPYHAGGCGIHVYQLSNLLAQEGHRVEVIHCIDSFYIKQKEKRGGEFPHHKNVLVHSVKSGLGKLSPATNYLFGYPLFTAGKLRKILNRGFDVIHYHNISLLGGPYVLNLGNGIKLFTLHTYWLFCPTHYLWKFKREVCRKKQCLVCQLSYGLPPQLWRYTNLRDKMLVKADSLIVPSQFMRGKQMEEGIKVRTDCISYFVFTHKVSNSDHWEKKLGKYKPFFLFVARIEPYKGAQVAVRAFRRKKGKSRLLIVGSGSSVDSVRVLAGSDPRIVFLGHVLRDELSWLYKNAMALVVPSVWPEMGNQAVLDAMSYGTPLIAAENGCLTELVGENGAGILYRSEAELVAAWDAMEDANLRSKYSAKARAAYEEHYTPQKFLEKYYQLVEQFL
ncbi:MAG: glycosyltransferase family 1 protein [Candidatus Aminicenantes bacterium]|nr:MAG: glycosyltransferase family 1 protein [Candidatus Aminicenantes bacterium]